MFHPRHFKTRPRTTVAAALALLLLFVTAVAPRPTHSSRRTRAEDPNPQIPSIPPGEAFRQKNIYSDVPRLSSVLDPFMVNPWGIETRALFGVACNGTRVIQNIRLDAQDNPVSDVTQSALNVSGARPTGMTMNNAPFPTPSGSFGQARAQALVGTLDGKVFGWNLQSSGVVFSEPGFVFTGFAGYTFSQGPAYFYGTDFVNNRIERWTITQLSTPPGAFQDPTIPAGYAPFNVQNVDDFTLYVTYAKVAAGGGLQPENGPGLGYVRKFSYQGELDTSFAINGGELDAPWGLALARGSFGPYADGTLFVGNFSPRGRINAYNATTGAYLGTLQNEAGQPVEIEWLRGLDFADGLFLPSAGLYFTSAVGGGNHGLLGRLTPTTQTATSLIHFSAADYSVGEGVGHLDVTVTRDGDVSGPASVNYTTFDRDGAGHASQKGDYEIALGTLNFAPGETSKTFRVLLVDDRLVEGPETIALALSNPGGAGAGLGVPGSAELTLLDNDTTPAASNPIDDSDFFVRQHYLDFLNREPDASGLQFWTGEIEQCGADSQCREVKRINVSAAFFLSIEFQSTGVPAYLAHKAAFGRLLTYGDFTPDVQQLQRNLVFGQPGFDAQLEANKRRYFDDFVARPDFVRSYGGRSDAQYVSALNSDAAAGGALTQAEVDALVAALANGTMTRAEVLRAVTENAAFRAREFNSAFVLMEYFGYLRRDPDAGGRIFWLDKLNQFNGDFIRAEMVKAFISSDEYRKRFGP